MTHTITFIARPRGAIGLYSVMQECRSGATWDDAVRSLYDEWDLFMWPSPDHSPSGLHRLCLREGITYVHPVGVGY